MSTGVFTESIVVDGDFMVQGDIYLTGRIITNVKFLGAIWYVAPKLIATATQQTSDKATSLLQPGCAYVDIEALFQYMGSIAGIESSTGMAADAILQRN